MHKTGLYYRKIYVEWPGTLFLKNGSSFKNNNKTPPKTLALSLSALAGFDFWGEFWFCFIEEKKSSISKSVAVF